MKVTRHWPEKTKRIGGRSLSALFLHGLRWQRDEKEGNAFLWTTEMRVRKRKKTTELLLGTALMDMQSAMLR